MKFFTASKSKV